MSLQSFMNKAISPWMRQGGPDSDIVLSSRIRLARNFESVPYPIIAKENELAEIAELLKAEYEEKTFNDHQSFKYISIHDLSLVERRVLVEKHLISPLLAKKSKESGVLLSKSEQISIMINEEDHLRIQAYFPGLQLTTALREAFLIDDWIEEKVDYAFDEEKGYLTSCPTNVGTGMRASVMMHLPALVLTKHIRQLVPAINQLGFVVRGFYGEGSEALGNVFQISNQMTLGKSEEDIVEDLNSIVTQLIEHERNARQRLLKESTVRLENRIFRSYGTLEYSRIIESTEATKCLSDVRLGIDLGIIEHMSWNILNELMVIIQPGFLQQYAQKVLTAKERDTFRATLIRERLKMEA